MEIGFLDCRELGSFDLEEEDKGRHFTNSEEIEESAMRVGNWGLSAPRELNLFCWKSRKEEKEEKETDWRGRILVFKVIYQFLCAGGQLLVRICIRVRLLFWGQCVGHLCNLSNHVFPIVMDKMQGDAFLIFKILKWAAFACEILRLHCPFVPSDLLVGLAFLWGLKAHLKWSIGVGIGLIRGPVGQINFLQSWFEVGPSHFLQSTSRVHSSNYQNTNFKLWYHFCLQFKIL